MARALTIGNVTARRGHYAFGALAGATGERLTMGPASVLLASLRRLPMRSLWLGLSNRMGEHGDPSHPTAPQGPCG